MKAIACILCFLLLTRGDVHAQLSNGTYYQAFPAFGDCMKLQVGPGNQVRLGEVTEASSATDAYFARLPLRYRIDAKQEPERLYIQPSGANSDPSPLLWGPYRRIDANNFLWSPNGEDGLKYFRDPWSAMVSQFSLVDSLDRIGQLLLMEQNPSCGFPVEKTERKLAPGVVETVYLLEGKPLRSNRFQSVELRTFDSSGSELSVKFLDANGKPMNNQYGFAEQRTTYDSRGRRVLEERFAADGKPMVFRGRAMPRSVYTYEDSLLVETQYLINNPAFVKTSAARVRFYYDSYGDRIHGKRFLANGTQIADDDERIATGFYQWLRSFVTHAESIRELASGRFGTGSSSGSDGKKVLNEYFLYTEFMLKDNNGMEQKVTAFFSLGRDFRMQAMRFKRKPEGSDYWGDWSEADEDAFREEFALTKYRKQIR